MESVAPYFNDPRLLIKMMTEHYNFELQEYGNYYAAKLPCALGEGGLQFFLREGMYFMRYKWECSKTTLFCLPDTIQEYDYVDFWIDARQSIVQSSFLSGSRNFEWDITSGDGICFFLSKKHFLMDWDIIKKLSKYQLDDNVSRLLKELFKISPENHSDSILLEGKFLQFIYFWFEYLDGEEIGNQFEGLSDSHIIRLKDAKQIIENTIDKPIGIKQLSRRVGINVSDLQKGFRKLNGLSIHQYVIKLRMEKANELLLNTDFTINEICSKLGYTNKGYFAQLYSKYFGILPYRQRANHRILSSSMG